jgi:hypothetical protein
MLPCWGRLQLTLTLSRALETANQKDWNRSASSGVHSVSSSADCTTSCCVHMICRRMCNLRRSRPSLTPAKTTGFDTPQKPPRPSLFRRVCEITSHSMHPGMLLLSLILGVHQRPKIYSSSASVWHGNVNWKHRLYYDVVQRRDQHTMTAATCHNKGACKGGALQILRGRTSRAGGR